MASVATEQDWHYADRIRLPLRFDAGRLAAELALLGTEDWVRHYVPQHFEGDWEVLPLRSKVGATHPIQRIYADPGATEFEDGPLLAHLPYLQEVLAAFACPLHAARLMRLTPGSVILEHRDHDLAAEWGMARIHVPVTTNDQVAFELNRRAVAMAPGEAWYLRLSDPHRVANHGSSDRVHLVIDAVVNGWLTAQLDAGS